MDSQKYLENLPKIEELRGKLGEIQLPEDDRKRVEAAFKGYEGGDLTFEQYQEMVASVFTPEFFERLDQMHEIIQQQRSLMGVD